MHLTQHQRIVDPNAISEHLTRYWHRFWTTDENNISTAQPHLFQRLLHQTLGAESMTVDTSNIDLWVQGIKDFKAHSSPGIDGIAPTELKQIPLSAIRDAMNILQSYVDGFPAWFMVARTCPLPKVTTTPEPSQIRPITVMSTLYRWWAKVIGKQVLQQLSHTLSSNLGLLESSKGNDTRLDRAM